MEDRESLLQRLELTSFGNFIKLNLKIDRDSFLSKISDSSVEWVPYNKTKTWSHRYGLSLFSLDGGTSGEIDLNSVREWNMAHGTNYQEMSFRAPTRYWNHFNSVFSILKPIEDFLGRSHILRLDEGGIFPPHRDNFSRRDQTFRLISFINCLPNNLHFIVDGQLQHFQEYHFYFLNTRLVHSLVSFNPHSYVLVFNVALNEHTVDFVKAHFEQI